MVKQKRKTKKQKPAQKSPRRKKKKKCFFGRLAKIFLALTLLFFVGYAALGISAGFEFLKKDLREKYGRVAGSMTVSVLVRGMPEKPVLSAVSGCSGGNPIVDLSWQEDLGVDTYDIYRGGLLLVSGITVTNWSDSNVTAGTIYQYYVIANGPVGTEQSDPVLVEISACETPPPPPPPASITIVTLDKLNVLYWRCLPQTKKTKPTFTGTTNLANALISVEIVSAGKKRKVISSFHSNANGYWSWKSQGRLKKGSKTVYFTVFDPDDTSNSASTSMKFKVSKSKLKRKKIKKCTSPTLINSVYITKKLSLSPLAFPDLVLESGEQPVYAGKEKEYSLKSPATAREAGFSLGILDQKGNLVYEENVMPQNDGQKVKISKNIPPGNYKLSVGYLTDDAQIAAEDDFTVRETPLIVLAPGVELTAQQIASRIGWAAFGSLLILLIILALLLFEYHLAGRAIFGITGYDLKKRDYVD